MRELIDRLKAATAPDRTLDIAILQATDTNGYKVEDDGTILVSGDMGDGPGWFNIGYEVPAFTESMDAALRLLDPTTMTLAEVSFSWNVDDPKVWPACTVRWYPPYTKEPNWHGRVTTSPLKAIAVCIAALEARQVNNERANAA